MIARRLTLATLASLCALVCALAFGTGSAAAATEFGEEGSQAGQFSNTFGVAVNATGDVFVADGNNNRIDSFDGSGNWLAAWGWDVNAESPAEALQTCTTVCQAGRSGASAGAYASGEGPHGVAVDNELGSLSRGDVYAVDRGNFRVEKFGPAGNFILTFGSGVLTAGASGEGTLTVASSTCSVNCAETITAVSTESRAFVTGQTITAANGGIPPGTTITGIGKANGTIELSRPATVSGSTKLAVAAGAGNVAVNERQTVTLGGVKAPTGGTFTLLFTSPQPALKQEETAAIAWDAPASGAGSVQAALEALPNIGPGNVAVTSPKKLGGPYTVEFTGTRYADTNVKPLEGSAEHLEPVGEETLEVATTVEGHSARADNVCSDAVDCVAGVEGEKEEGPNASAQFNWYFQGSYVAVGPGGDVYVGDQARVQVFDETGALKKEIPLEEPTFPRYGKVSALAVDPTTGEMSVVENFANGVHQFNTAGTEVGAFDTTSEGRSIKGVALDAETGDLYVEDCSAPSSHIPECEPTGGSGPQNTNYHFLKYDAKAGEELASFGSKTILYSSGGMALSDAANALYAAGTNFTQHVNTVGDQRMFVFTPPPPGPLIESHSESGTPERHGAAKFEAEVIPEGHATTYHVEYIAEERFQADGEVYGAGTVKTVESAPIAGTSAELFEDHRVVVNLPEASLVPGTTYRWRLVATDSLSQKTTGEGSTLEETSPAVIDGPWASEVTATSAKLAARINPEGLSTGYRLQYGTSTAYEHELSGNLSAGSAFVAIGYPVQALKPGTTYHYRVVTVNECITGRTCTQDGADHTFTTRPGASEFALPDGRAWELVTPPDTKGSVLEPSFRQAASDGSAIFYLGSGPLGGNVLSNSALGQGANVLSRRGPEGWGSQDISLPIKPLKEGENYSKTILNLQRYLLFSPDLASALYEPETKQPVLTADALEGTGYLLNNVTCRAGELASCYKPLLSSANTPPGTEINHLVLDAGLNEYVTSREAQIAASTPDLAHVVLGSPLPLTAGAHAYTLGGPSYGNLYEWGAGRLQLVNILPSGKPDESNSAELAGQGGYSTGAAARVLSSDGRRIAWTIGSRYGTESSAFKALYIRDMAEGKTVQIGTKAAYYQMMSSDGSRVFFLENGDLYEYHVAPGVSYDAGTTTDLTASHGPGEASAGVQELITDVSQDGSYVYFVGTGVLSSARNATGEKALAGADNLYVLHNEGGTWGAPQFIARLSTEDEKSWGFHEGNGNLVLGEITSRVSPDGRYLAFMSSRSLTGYDNVDLNPEAKGARDEEVFLYHAPQRPAAESGSLICASCDPSGARPHGLSGATSSLATTLNSVEWRGHWLAGNLPGWKAVGGGAAELVYQPRYLSDSGRLFFNSPIALVPHDTNGLEDVYQYEPAGSGGVNGCTSASATFNARTGGCVDLISSGQSAGESVFMDAGENGNDVFFLSSHRLTAADIDSGYDVWDAHVCSASSPCTAPPASLPPCSEESCRGTATPQPELFGAPPSATFSGAGNVVPASRPAVKPKVLTRAQKLSRALGSCRKQYKRSKQRRAACERAAHKRYGHAAKRSRKANAIKRGGK